MFEGVARSLFGDTRTLERTADDVDALVDGYQSPESTKTLLDFGRQLQAANDDRIAAIDSKAQALVGYSAAVLAFMVGQGATLAGGPVWRNFLVLLAGLCAVGACMSAGLALRSARNWKNMGEATWFPDDLATVDDPDKLGRWYLRAMHESLQSNHRITNQKAYETIRAQVAVAAAATFLALSVVGDSIAAIWAGF